MIDLGVFNDFCSTLFDIFIVIYQWLDGFVVSVGIGLFRLLWFNGGTYRGHLVFPNFIVSELKKHAF